MKNNKFFIMMLLGAVILSGTSFEMQGLSYSEQLRQLASTAGQSVSSMATAGYNMANAGYQAFTKYLPGRDTMSTWANKVVSMLSENRKEALFAALALALGGSYYAYQQYLSRQDKDALIKGLQLRFQNVNEEDNLSNIRKILDQWLSRMKLSSIREKNLGDLLEYFEGSLPDDINVRQWIDYSGVIVNDYIQQGSPTPGKLENHIENLVMGLGYLQCWQKHTAHYQDNKNLQDAIEQLIHLKKHEVLKQITEQDVINFNRKLINAIRQRYSNEDTPKNLLYSALLTQWTNFIEDSYSDKIVSDVVNELLKEYYTDSQDKQKNISREKITEEDVAAAREKKAEKK